MEVPVASELLLFLLITWWSRHWASPVAEECLFFPWDPVWSIGSRCAWYPHYCRQCVRPLNYCSFKNRLDSYLGCLQWAFRREWCLCSRYRSWRCRCSLDSSKGSYRLETQRYKRVEVFWSHWGTHRSRNLRFWLPMALGICWRFWGLCGRSASIQLPGIRRQYHGPDAAPRDRIVCLASLRVAASPRPNRIQSWCRRCFWSWGSKLFWGHGGVWVL